MPIRSATGYTPWRFLQGVHDAFVVPQARQQGPAPLAAGDAAVVISCPPGFAVVRARFTAGGLAGSTAGVPACRVRKAP